MVWGNKWVVYGMAPLTKTENTGGGCREGKLFTEIHVPYFIE